MCGSPRSSLSGLLTERLMFLQHGCFYRFVTGGLPFPVDTSDELVVDIHLLALAPILRHHLLMHHDLLNQLVENVGCEFGDIQTGRRAAGQG